MIVLQDKQSVIDIYKEAGRPLDGELLQSIEEVDAELSDLHCDHRFVILELQCRVCGHECVGIVPMVADLDNLECDVCENMSSQEKDSPEWWETGEPI